MRHLLVIDELEKLNIQLDSSLKMSRAFQDFGDQVQFSYIDSLAWNGAESSATATCFDLQIDEKAGVLKAKNRSRVALSEYDSIHMRKEPPLDMRYIEACWLLNSARKEAVIYNDPERLVTINEKLSIYHFPDFADAVLVSANVDEIVDFAKKEAQGDIIIKPLGLYGGRGVKRLQVQESQEKDFVDALNEETQKGVERRIIQPFNREIFKGEIRVFGFKDHVLSWCLKKPAKGSYFANTREGATLESYQPSDALRAQVVSMGARLAELGIKVWGIDVIGENLSEINVTSPRMLVVGEDEQSYYREFIELVRKDIQGS